MDGFFGLVLITPLGYNCHPSLKTPAEKPLFGVLIIIFEVVNGNKTSLSTQDPEARARAWFSPAHGQCRWSSGAQTAAPERPHPADRPQQQSR
jgi:hypothetical protein